eukprot:scaffold71879_cov66-Phaeocystis_antarctica.AAC.1
MALTVLSGRVQWPRAVAASRVQWPWGMSWLRVFKRMSSGFPVHSLPQQLQLRRVELLIVPDGDLV